MARYTLPLKQLKIKWKKTYIWNNSFKGIRNQALKNRDPCPGWVAPLVGMLSYAPKSFGFDSGQGGSLGCRFDPWLGHIWEAAKTCFSLCITLCLHSCLSKISKHILGSLITKKSPERWEQMNWALQLPQLIALRKFIGGGTGTQGFLNEEIKLKMCGDQGS